MNNYKPFMSKSDAKQITDKLIVEDWNRFRDTIKSKKLKDYFNTLKLPKIIWKKFGFAVAGRAYLDENKIEMNENFLYSIDYKEFVTSTFKHELAHILAYELYGELNHGRPWKIIDKNLGDDGKACHNYNDPINKPIRKNQVRLICKHGCHHVISNKFFKKIQVEDYICTRCNHNMKEATATTA